ncbi:MAG TPA: A24 family peptidase [Stellaceae bacterium]|nr:A24 family peptidase [Stellaceae bacterium]
MISVVLALAVGVLGWAAYGDARWRRIPNEVSIAVAALGALRLVLAGDPGAALRTVVVAAIVLAVSFLLFARGVFGGGDAKLISGATLLVGSARVLDFLLLTSIFGALLVPIVLLAGRAGPSLAGLAGAGEQVDTGTSTKPPRPTIPYGVAISAASVVVLLLEFLQK